MIKFAALGGDGRTEFTAQYLSDKGYHTEIIHDLNSITEYDAVILPLPFTIDNIHIKGTEINIDDFIKSIDNAIVFAGKLNKDISEKLVKNQIKYYDYNAREEFSQKNAVPTAQGVLTFVLNNINVTFNQLNIAVIGYGKCGKAICKTFKNLGSEVSSYSRRYSSAADAESEGIKAYLIKYINDTIFNADIVINTVPALIIDKSVLDCINKKAMLIDVSSNPYGFDYDYADKINKKVNLLSSLPGKYVQITAGKIIAETIINIIEEGGLWKE